MGKSGTGGGGVRRGRRVFRIYKDEFGCIKNQMSLKRTRTPIPVRALRTYLGRAIKNPPFEGESEEVGRSRSRDNCAEENFSSSFLSFLLRRTNCALALARYGKIKLQFDFNFNNTLIKCFSSIVNSSDKLAMFETCARHYR